MIRYDHRVLTTAFVVRVDPVVWIQSLESWLTRSWCGSAVLCTWTLLIDDWSVQIEDPCFGKARP